MPHLATIVFSGLDWFWPAIVLGVLAVAVLLWGYRYVRLPGGPKSAAILLKLLGFALLVVALLEPMWSSTKPKPGANLLGVVVDTSQGMSVEDADSGETRGEMVAAKLGNADDPQHWLNQLEETFKLRRYEFDSRLRRTDNFNGLEFEGTASSLATSLKTLAQRYEGKPLGAVLLFTDGNATDLAGQDLDWESLPPIYPVIPGGGEAGRDLAVENVIVSQTLFEDSPVTIGVDVRATGFADEELSVTLRDKEGSIVESKALPVTSSDATETVRFRFKPSKPGVSFYTASVGLASGAAEEATARNNSREIAVDRGGKEHRVLYVTGRPNWEFKFLNRALAEDSQVSLVGLIRVAKREPKFVWQGRRGEDVNPIFRGFGTDPDAEGYDQPVLVRLNTLNAEELATGFPKTEEQLFNYSAIIVDDLEADFFSPDQKDLIQSFVSRRGGGFLMLGGQESFREGGYDQTPIGQVLPVYLDKLPDAFDGWPGEMRMDLSREGWLQPWARLRENEEKERLRMSTLPEFKVLNRVRAIKPGASIMATVKGPNNREYPALVVQRYGSGRSAALMIGDFWRSGFKNEELLEDMSQFWRQLNRYVVKDVPSRVNLTVERDFSEGNQLVRLTTTVYNEVYQPLDNADVKVLVTDAEGKNLTVEAEPVIDRSGIYEAIFIPRGNGAYHAEAVVTDAEEKIVGKDETGWTINLAAEEFKNLSVNRAFLADLARRTGGEVFELDDVEDAVDELPEKEMPVTEPWTRPLWHTPVLFILALACFVGEWGLRRWKGAV